MSFLLLSKFTIELDKKIGKCEGQLTDISQSYSPKAIFASNYEAQVMSLLDKIKSLNQEKDRVFGRVGKMRNLITSQLDTLLTNLQDAMNALNKSMPSDHKVAKLHAYLFSALINIFENLKKGWDDHLQSLRTISVDIFNFL